MTRLAFDDAVTALSEDEELKGFWGVMALEPSKFSAIFREMLVSKVLERDPPSEWLEATLIEWAEDDPRIFDALKICLGSKLMGWKPRLSLTMQYWLGEVTSGIRKRPPSSGSADAFAGAWRNACLRVAIWKAERFGFNPTRNIASGNKSACDVVKAALQTHGLFLTYDTIAKARYIRFKADPVLEDWLRQISYD